MSSSQSVSEQFLQAQLECSTFSNDAGVDSAPHITPADSHTLLERFADLANSLTADPGMSDITTQQQLKRVLKLAAMLWGPLPSDIDPGMNLHWVRLLAAFSVLRENFGDMWLSNLPILIHSNNRASLSHTVLFLIISDPDSYGNQMARRKGVYDWLRETNEQATDEEASCADEGYLKALFSLVSGQQLSKACRLAQKHHDHKLALIFSQATQNTMYNR